MVTRRLVLEACRLHKLIALLGFAISLAACTGLPPDVGANEVPHDASAEARITDPARDRGEVLTPWQIITGGRQVTRVDAVGFPIPGALEGFVSLISPTAVAARGTDIYIADSGARRLYRYDSMLQTLSVIPDYLAVPWTRLQTGVDGSLFALDAGSSTITHFTRAGKPLQTLSDPLSTARLSEFAVDESLGKIIASDQMNRRLVELYMLGKAARILDTAEPLALGALALAGRTIYALDAQCSCIVAMNEEGGVRERIGQGVLVQPRALAVDHFGQIFVADSVDRTLKIFLHGALIAGYKTQTLGITEISALAVNDGILYVADGPGARVIAMRINPPKGAKR